MMVVLQLEKEIDRLRAWIRRIENINDDPAVFNKEIDDAVRRAWHGEPMTGRIRARLPDPPQ